ncbi:WD40-repeat-containing domain protein [Suillus clintonianus]|uniref:WD40-repeat-containing domain protein n=1 Tax=Suillus clintonianus TaxID=1904413 RepID=UPI001B87E0F7|nr:WD40-repeat-containing domain protein [Suillus clintonianus]KAG2146838.1 WD40-repeat-containing domain protein [Suillus clintonianus]
MSEPVNRYSIVHEPWMDKFKPPPTSMKAYPKHTFKGHERVIQEFVFLHDNVHIVSGSWDGTMRKWNCNTGHLVGAPWKGKGGKIYALALSPDGKMIACGREDGSVQRWNTDGEMIAGVWTGHSNAVRSLSWSPSGDHLASGSKDGTILIRKAESGQVEVGPIETEQIDVCALAYSPSGNRIASGGESDTICIWNTKTGKLVVGPIEDLGNTVTSKSGKLLHSFEHNYILSFVALSPKHNILACVGDHGIAKLWDTESLRPLAQLSRDPEWLYHVSFSPDGHHLAYAGYNKKLTLWSVKVTDPQLVASILPQQSDRHSIQQETRPNSPSLASCLEAETRPNSPSSSDLDVSTFKFDRLSSLLTMLWQADATGGDGIIEGNDNPYDNFFQSSRQSLPPATPGSHLPHLFSARRFFKVFSRPHPPADESVQKERSKRKFFARRARSNSSVELAAMSGNPPVQEGKVGEGKGEQGDNDRGSANDPPSARKDEGDQRDEAPTDAQSPPSHDPTHPDDLGSKDNRNLWKRMMRGRGKVLSDTNIAPAMKHPKVVEVSAVRGFQRYIAMKRVRKTQPSAVTGSIPHLGASSSQPGSSSQVVSVQAGPSSYVVVGNGAQSSQATGGTSLHPSPSHAVAVNPVQSFQAIGGPSPDMSPSHFVTNHHTNHDSDSHTTIEGSFNRFLVWMCYPCGRYNKDY